MTSFGPPRYVWMSCYLLDSQPTWALDLKLLQLQTSAGIIHASHVELLHLKTCKVPHSIVSAVNRQLPSDSSAETGINGCLASCNADCSCELGVKSNYFDTPYVCPSLTLYAIAPHPLKTSSRLEFSCLLFVGPLEFSWFSFCLKSSYL